MDKPAQGFKVNSRVRLRDGIDSEFYGGYARVGNEGWVRAVDHDRYGYSRIKVEWDKDHWSYNGVPDMWTWQGHFDIVEEPMAKNLDKDALNEIVGDFTTHLWDLLNNETEDVDHSPPGDEDNLDWEAKLTEAAELLLRSRAYVLVAIGEEDDNPLTYPIIYHDARKEELSLIVQAQLSQVCAAFQNNLVTKRIDELDAE